jgi:perosamine synthetase
LIQHNKPELGKEESLAVNKVLKSGMLAQGEEVKHFEDEFCNFLGLPIGHAVAVSSGTAALYLALWALNAENKNIAFPSYVCSALRHGVAMVGAKEHLVDITSDSPNINLEIINKIKPDIAIIPHMYGIPVNVNSLEGIPIIEDCCQSLGAVIEGKSTGINGDLGIFSFYATKLMTTGGQGGMVVSKKKDFIESITDFREFDYRADNKKRFNFQMTDLQATIGRQQLRKLPDFLERREKIYKMYKDSGLELLDVQKNQRKKLIPVRYRTVLKTPSPQKTIKKLLKNNIRAIVPIEDWELLDDGLQCPNALKLTKNTVSIPCFPSLTNNDVKKIIKSIKS